MADKTLVSEAQAGIQPRVAVLPCLLVIGAVAFMLAGFLGLDRWFYERVSLRFNTPNMLGTDGYSWTALLCWIARLWPHIYGCMIAWCAIAMFHPRGLRAANAGLLTVLSVSLVARVAQLGIGRVRPNMSESHLAFVTPLSALRNGGGVGFPSGEVATGFALAWVLGHLWPRGKPWFYGAATLCLLARLLPGMHYLSDVAAGVLLGVGMAWALFGVYDDRVIAWLATLRRR